MPRKLKNNVPVKQEKVNFKPTFETVTIKKWLAHDGTEFNDEEEVKAYNRKALISLFLVGAYGTSVVADMSPDELALIEDVSEKLGRRLEDLIDELYNNKLLPDMYGTKDDF